MMEGESTGKDNWNRWAFRGRHGNHSSGKFFECMRLTIARTHRNRGHGA